MRACGRLIAFGTLLASFGCQGPQPPVFPAIDPPMVFPQPPDPPRIRYVGQIRGEPDLHARRAGWAAVEAFLTGPRPQGGFVRPVAVAARGDLLFVADAGAAVVHRLDLARREYGLITGPAGGRFEIPIDLAVVADRLHVVDRQRTAIDVFTLSGQFERTLSLDALTAPVSLAWDRGNAWFWVADAEQHRVVALDERGVVQRSLGARGMSPGGFNFPSAVAYATNVGLVVVDAMNFRVQVLDPATSRPQVVFGGKGDAAGDFARPRSVALDAAGHVYVLDNQFENIQIFDRDGRLLLAFGGGGSAPGRFAIPADIFIDDQDRIWIADSYNQRVQVFQYLHQEQPT